LYEFGDRFVVEMRRGTASKIVSRREHRAALCGAARGWMSRSTEKN